VPRPARRAGDHTTELAEDIQDPVGDHDALLLALATRIAPAAPELRDWADLDAVVCAMSCSSG
jgi:hypothetical protein